MHVGQLHLSLPSFLAGFSAEGLELDALFSHSHGPFLEEVCKGKFNSHSHLSSKAHLYPVFKTLILRSWISSITIAIAVIFSVTATVIL